MKLYSIIASLLAAVLFSGPTSAAESVGKSPLADDAEIWLRMLDEGKFEEAWQQTDQFFQSVISHDDFLKFAKRIRQPLGAAQRRVVWDESFRENAQGRPDGPYFAVKFQTTFPPTGPSRYEHILLAPDGCQWKVTRYMLR